ncbi:hypothetical protein ACFX14_008994 [Malus domestica]
MSKRMTKLPNNNYSKRIKNMVSKAQANEKGWKPEEDAKNIMLDPQQPKKTTRIGSRLSPKEKEEFTVFLRENRDIFAWSPFDMPDIDPEIACHKLHVDLVVKPVI